MGKCFKSLIFNSTVSYAVNTTNSNLQNAKKITGERKDEFYISGSHLPHEPATTTLSGLQVFAGTEHKISSLGLTTWEKWNKDNATEALENPASTASSLL